MAAHISPPQPSHRGVHQSSNANFLAESAQTQTRRRFIWTQQLHNQFKEAIAYLGPRKAVPSAIMRLMNVDGLTRKNVASHLQKYRLYLKRRQEATVTGVVVPEFPRQSNFVSHNLLQSNCVYPCYMPVRSAAVGVALQHYHGMVVPIYNPYIRVPIPNPWLVGQFGSSSPNGSLMQPFVYRAENPNVVMGIPVRTPDGYVQDVEPANGNGRELKLLNLFPMKDE